MSDYIGPYISLADLMRLKLYAKSLSLPKAKSVKRPQTGFHHSKFKGRGMEFSEVRVYQPGDDIRSIDWRVTARRNTPHTKIFNEERERPVLILCDQSQSMFFGSRYCFKSVKAAEIAALFSWVTLKHNDRVGGIVFSNTSHKEVKPARSRKSVMQLLSYIERFNNSLSITTENEGTEQSFNPALRQLTLTAKPGTLVVIISDFIQVNNESERYFSKLSQHNELMFIHVYDQLEAELPPPGIYPVSKGNETIVINSHDALSRQKYKAFFTEKAHMIKQISARCRAPYLEIATHEAIPSSLIDLLSAYARS